MRRLLTIIGLILVVLWLPTPSPAAEPLQATLEPLDQSNLMSPLLPVKLTLQSAVAGSGKLNLQDTQGGPVYQYPTNLVADQPTLMTVYLPPLSTNQTYRIWLNGATPGDPITAVADLAWPAEKVKPEIFYNSAAYEPFRYDLPAWPPSMTWRAILAGVALCIALWCILLIRSPGWRAFCFLIILAAATAYLLLSPRPETLIQETHGDLLVLRSRRTCEFKSANWRLIPLYATGLQFEQDATTISMASPAYIATTVYPNQARIFKIVKPTAAPATPPETDSAE